MTLEAELREYFGEGEKRVVLVGVGNPMRCDDGVGPRIIELLEKKPLPNVMLLNTETVPEAFTGKVKTHDPTHVLVLDAANIRGTPGETRMITSDEIGGKAISTHSLPLNIFISFIEKTLDVNVILLGIQPISNEFYKPMTKELEKAAIFIADTLHKVLSQ